MALGIRLYDPVQMLIEEKNKIWVWKELIWVIHDDIDCF